jgi:arsenite-transporting ATPase
MPPVLPPFRPDAASASRFLFFTGKGGVGKTSLSSATALRLADAGRRVLLVSTDPASNLDEVLGLPLDRTPRDVPGAPGLQAMNINPMEAAAAYRERVVGPMRGLLPDDVLRGMEEQLSGSCTIEIAAFDEFAALLGDPASARAFDHVVFDTAPTGHTLRLMSLAGAWDRFLDGNTSGASCIGPLAGLERQRAVYENAVRTLSDKTQTTLVLVTRPQTGALREAERTAAELRSIGVTRQLLVVNGVFHAATPDDPVAAAMHARADAALRAAEGFLTSLPVFAVPLRAANVLGLARLRDLLQDDAGPVAAPTNTEALALPENLLPLGAWIDRLPRPVRGVILTMGKGGVGKTTVAAAIATALARRGVPVHLTTTDPAAHIRDTLLDGANDLAPDALPLTVGSIDPEAETKAYRSEVLATAGRDLDAASLALLEEDLRSPCTEEIAVFRAFAREVARGGERLVVLDTAPTGHTLLLLDATQSHHRELVRQARADHPPEVLHLLARLRDPAYTRVLLVTLPEATPVHEAAALQDDLRRAGIEPAAWVVNQGLPGCGSADPLLRARAESERRYLGEVAAQHAHETVFIPWQLREPRGLAALLDLSNATSEPGSRHA